MDCKTARFLFDYARPRAHELDPAEAADLEKHLASCTECDEAFRALERVDTALGKAMRQVEVPDRLRSHLLARLETERSDWYRQRLGYVLRGLAAAAVLVVVGWGVWHLTQPALPPVDLNEPFAQLNEITPTARSKAQVESILGLLGRNVPAPVNINYSCLASCGLADFQGQPTPQLLFFSRNDDMVQAHAYLYILSDRHFDLRSLARPDMPPHTGYRYKVAVTYRDGDHYAYVYLYTGDNLSWLKPAGDPS